MPLTFFRGIFRRAPGPSTSDILRNVTPQRLIVAITGATGAIYGVRLLEMLREAAIETHLVISPWGRRTLLHETTYTVDQVQRLATVDICAERSGRGDFERLVSDHGHGDRAVQHAHARVGRAWAGRQPDSSRRGCRAEGAAQAAACSARSAAQRHSSREHAQAVAHGGRHLPADARVLPAPRHDRRPRQPQRRPDARSVRRAHRRPRPLGRRVRAGRARQDGRFRATDDSARRLERESSTCDKWT